MLSSQHSFWFWLQKKFLRARSLCNKKCFYNIVHFFWFTAGDMFCVNNVCVGQPCNQSSECPNREKCFDGKCLKSIIYNISNNSSRSNNTNNNETSSCRHHEECSNRNQTHVCSRRRLNFNIYFCHGRISPRAVASLPLYHALIGIKVLVRFNSMFLLTAL